MLMMMMMKMIKKANVKSSGKLNSCSFGCREKIKSSIISLLLA